MDKFFSTPAETDFLTLGEKFAARRKNLENHICLLMKRYPEPECCEAISLLRERLAKISEKEVG